MTALDWDFQWFQERVDTCLKRGLSSRQKVRTFGLREFALLYARSQSLVELSIKDSARCRGRFVVGQNILFDGMTAAT